MEISELHQKLRQLVGQKFHYQGQEWLLIEILVEEDLLVLCRQGDCEESAIQVNQYGLASRRTQMTMTIPISDVSGQYSQEALELLGGRL